MSSSSSTPVNSSDTESGETQPLLGYRKVSSSAATIVARWRNFMTEDVGSEWADFVLLYCYLITGLLDSSTTSLWGSFVSMQTGNSIYIGLGLAAPHESTRWIRSSCSLACFCIGSFLFARLHWTFSPLRRWVLCLTAVIQLVLIVAAACLVTFGPRPRTDDEVDWTVLVPIALVAVQSAGQAVASRALKMPALTSVVLTSLYCDLFSDTNLFAFNNVERNRRFVAPVMLLIGAVCGGFFAHSPAGIAGSLWSAAILKLGIVLCWLRWPATSKPVMVQ